MDNSVDGVSRDRDLAKAVEEGVAKHERTTLAIQEAEKIVNTTRDAARATVLELHSQEKQLHRIDKQHDEAAETVGHAEGLLQWFAACACCKCCVPDPRSHNPKASVNQAPPPQVVPVPMTMKAQNGARSDLSAPSKEADNWSKVSGPGATLGGELGERIQKETLKQNEGLDNIEDALEDLQTAAVDIKTQLDRQAALEDQIADKNEKLHSRVQRIAKDIKYGQL